MQTPLTMQYLSRRSWCAAGLAAALTPALAATKVPIALDGNAAQKQAVQLLAPDLGFEADLQVVPWARLLSLIERGEAIGMGVGHSHSREKRFVFSAPIYVKRIWMLLKQADPLAYRGFADLQGRRLCLRRNVSYGDDFEAAAGRDYQLVPVDVPLETRLRMILADRCDLTVVSSGEIQPGRPAKLLAKWPELAAELKVLPTPMTTQTAHFVALKGSPLARHMPAINRAINRHKDALRELFERGGD